MGRTTRTTTLIIFVLLGVLVFTLVYIYADDSDFNHKVELSDVQNTKMFVQKFGKLEHPAKEFRNEDVQQLKVPQDKTIVYRHNGQDLERLHDFCTWTLPMDCADLKTPGGPVTIFIHDVEDDPGLSGVLKKTGIRDPENVDVVINELKKYPDAGFFDFGSHIGVYSLSIAHTLGRSVVAADPMIENTMRLCKSIQANKLTDKIRIVFSPLSNETTKVSFQRVHHHIGATTVLKSSDTKGSPCDDSPSYSVTMDDLISIVPFKTAVMKLDVEKSEYFAIQGGQKFLDAIDVRSILMEWYNIMQTPHVEPLVELMKKLKYVPYLPEANGEHKRLNYEDHKDWRKHRFLLDILFVKE